MCPRITVVDYVEVIVSCSRVPYRIRFKAGQLDDDDHPGVCALILSQRVKEEMMGVGYFPSPDGVRIYRDMESFFAENSDIILDYEELTQGKGASGDCFCFKDSKRNWRCICEN